MAVYAPKIPSILHRVREIEAQPEPVVAFGREYPSGHLIERHNHHRAQLIFASKGIMRVATPGGIWVVPPMRAIWVPPLVDHEIRVSSAVCLRTLFIQPSLRESLPQECCVVEVSPLLRELILRVFSQSESADPKPMSEHMIELILDEIHELEAQPLRIPLPTDPRALRICRSILQNPADVRTCAQWGVIVGASSRTLERLFQRETGVTFGVWRQQARLLTAFSRLAAQAPISSVALDLGYRSPSAFAAMFKRTLGCPPSEFFDTDVVAQ